MYFLDFEVIIYFPGPTIVLPSANPLQDMCGPLKSCYLQTVHVLFYGHLKDRQLMKQGEVLPRNGIKLMTFWNQYQPFLHHLISLLKTLLPQSATVNTWSWNDTLKLEKKGLQRKQVKRMDLFQTRTLLSSCLFWGVGENLLRQLWTIQNCIHLTRGQLFNACHF